MKRRTVYEFVEKANEVHVQGFDYSQIKYVYSSQKVTIRCLRCNANFEQTPKAHLKGAGCPRCSRYRKDTSKFIADAIAIHGGKYSYRKVDYSGYRNKVTITCPIDQHGDFEQTPSAHLRGQACPRCGGSMKKTASEFIEAARQRHKNKYSYEKAIYVNSKTLVTIYCSIHDLDFKQSPRAHLNGGVCPECSKTRRKTTEEFIRSASLKHGNKYSYDKVVYAGNDKKVTITCRKNNHGDFDQKPNKHLRGQGCPKCGGAQRSNSETFVSRAKEEHGDRYGYDLVRYVNSKSKVDIFCSKEGHGLFSQVAQYHLSGHGCPKCGNNLLTDVVDFVAKAKLKHGNSYKYDNVVYIDRTTKVEIICNFHGPFWQRPSNHLNGQGCPKCKKSIGEVEVEKHLTLLGVKFEEQYSFDDCVYKKALPFDFAIFINEQIGLIEYHGEQHFQVISYGRSKTPLREVQKRDDRKKKYAAMNEIPLLSISYKEFDEIETKIIEFIDTNFR